MREEQLSLNKPVVIKDLLRKLNKTYRSLLTKEFSEFGITMPQLVVVREIIEEKKTIGQISKAVDLSYSTVSGIIDRLERANLVERARDVHDRRVIWIQKTGEFDEIVSQIPLLKDEFYAQLFEDLSEDELDSIIHSMNMLIIVLERAEEKNKKTSRTSSSIMDIWLVFLLPFTLQLQEQAQQILLP